MIELHFTSCTAVANRRQFSIMHVRTCCHIFSKIVTLSCMWRMMSWTGEEEWIAILYYTMYIKIIVFTFSEQRLHKAKRWNESWSLIGTFAIIWGRFVWISMRGWVMPMISRGISSSSTWSPWLPTETWRRRRTTRSSASGFSTSAGRTAQLAGKYLISFDWSNVWLVNINT